MLNRSECQKVMMKWVDEKGCWWLCPQSQYITVTGRLTEMTWTCQVLFCSKGLICPSSMRVWDEWACLCLCVFLSLFFPHPLLSFWSGLCKLTSQRAGAAWQRSGTLVRRYKLQNQWCQPGHPHLSIIFWQDEFTCTLTITCWWLCRAGVLLGWRGPGFYWKITSHIFLSSVGVLQIG